MNIGDWLVFGGMGSYAIGPASEFNGMSAQSKYVIWDSELNNNS